MKRMPITALALAVIGGFLAGALPTAGEPEPAADLYEAWYRLEARTRSSVGTADIEAAGRLLLRRDDSGQGLELVRVLEAPWKLYAVESLLGSEVKVAAEVGLEAPTWEALAEARAEVDRFAAERYAAWRARGGTLPFDGAFCFVVLGPPAGRFRLSWAPALSVTNRLTDRWLSGELGPLLERWQAGSPPLGYWFWNRGETRPFAWEPHTYHAFAKALELLAVPSRNGSEAERRELLLGAREVLSTLMPRSRGRFPSDAPVHRFERCRQPEGRSGRPEEETLRLEAGTPEGLLSLAVGVQPAGALAKHRCNAPVAGTASGDVR